MFSWLFWLNIRRTYYGRKVLVSSKLSVENAKIFFLYFFIPKQVTVCGKYDHPKFTKQWLKDEEVEVALNNGFWF